MHISIQEAIELLQAGQVVALPTETVYGLAACVSSQPAIASLFSLKGRPSDNPLIIHIGQLEQIESLVPSPWMARIAPLAAAHWPGPLTLVVPVKENAVPVGVRAGLPTAAFRMPAHDSTRAIINATGPLAMPSANRSGSPSSTQPSHVEHDFGRHFPVVDGGPCPTGLESTILVWEKERWVIGRLGALTPTELAPLLGYLPVKKRHSERPICPGQHYRHYAPKASLTLTSNAGACQGPVVGFRDRSYPHAHPLLFFGLSDEPEEAAEQLYAILRQLDELQLAQAYIDIDFPKEGLWETILERLQKAASR